MARSFTKGKMNLTADIAERNVAVFKNGRFDSPLDSTREFGLRDIIKWMLTPKPKRGSSKCVKCSEDFGLNGVCWFGHATFYIRVNGFHLMCDPVFFDIPFHKRSVRCDLLDRIERVDAVLISHSHYDHLDLKSLKELISRFDPLFIVPKRTSLPAKAKVVEMEWFEFIDFGALRVIFFPAKHWSSRSWLDKNRSLWGSFMIEGEKSIFFAGDSAYAHHFSDISRLCETDIAILPIGAYSPEYLMSHSHMNPYEALKAFYDLGADVLIPMHYGVFDLSLEPLCEPYEVMKTVFSKAEFLNIGECYTW